MTDRLRTLDLLERLRRHDMLSEARALAELRAHINRLEEVRSTLHDKLRTEARIVTIESAPYVGSFIRALRREEAQIDLILAQTAQRLQELEEAVAAQFAALATVRHARDATHRSLQQDADRRATQTVEEQSLQRWYNRP
jgi:flagellar protein FliJ